MFWVGNRIQIAITLLVKIAINNQTLLYVQIIEDWVSETAQ